MNLSISSGLRRQVVTSVPVTSGGYQLNAARRDDKDAEYGRKAQ
jgi:hypothetical protein